MRSDIVHNYVFGVLCLSFVHHYMSQLWLKWVKSFIKGENLLFYTTQLMPTFNNPDTQSF